MMTSTHILRALTVTALLLPVCAQAYMSPEDVLTSDQNIQYYAPPPAAREAEAVQARQQAEVAARREAEQKVLFAQQQSASSGSMSDEQSSATPDQNALFMQQLMNQMNQQNAGLSPSDQRILDRVKEQQTEAEIQLQVAQILASQQSLHGGAPLADTGTGTYIVAFVLAAAGIWTIWKAKQMEKRN